MIALVIPRRDLTEIRLDDRRAAPEAQRRGVLISQGYEGGPEQHIDLIQCCHCQQVFPFVRNSGVERGWCMNCGQITCGRHECDDCVPWQQMIANMEAGMPWAQAKRHRPIVGRVEAEPPRASLKTRGQTDSGILLPG